VERDAVAVLVDVAGMRGELVTEALCDAVGIPLHRQNALPNFLVRRVVLHVPAVGHGVAMITEQPGFPTASMYPPMYPSADEISVSSGFIVANVAYGLQSGTP